MTTTNNPTWLAAPGVVLAVLLPKCPLCVAALLSSLGFGAALATRLAPLLHGLAFGVAVLAIAAGLAGVVLRVRRAARMCACARGRSPRR